MAEPHGTSATRCTWCGAPVDPEDGYRASEQPGARRATFCRLEHIVPWVIKGAHWEAGDADDSPWPQARCAHCDRELSDVYVSLVRHRGEHRIHDVFCSTDHMKAWAAGGGRWR
jgi:hypothetical protein